MAAITLTGNCQPEGLPAVLRALYSALIPEVVGTMEKMPDIAFVPASAEGAVANGGEEGININADAPPMVTRINTNSAGWLLGFRPEQFVGQIAFTLGSGKVHIVPSQVFIVILYTDREAHAAEYNRVSEAVTPHLRNVRVQ